MEVNQKDLANIFNITPRSVRDWDKNGCPSIINNKIKTYDTKNVIDWYVKRKIEETNDGLTSDDEDLKQALRLKAIAEADIKQADAEIKFIELAKKRNDVVLKEHVENIMNDLIAEIKQSLDSLPVRYASMIGVAKDDIERRQMLNKAVDEVKVLLINIDLMKIEEEDLNNELEDDDNKQV